MQCLVQPPLFGPNFPCSRSMMLGSAESEHPRLTNGQIIFELFQTLWSRYLNVTDRQTDGQTVWCKSIHFWPLICVTDDFYTFLMALTFDLLILELHRPFTGVRGNFSEKYKLFTIYQYWVNKRYDRQTDRQRDRQTDRQTDKYHNKWTFQLVKSIRRYVWNGTLIILVIDLT